MSIERVREYFRKLGIEDRVMEIDESSATVALAANALGCQEGRIAKTISFSLDGEPILIVMKLIVYFEKLVSLYHLAVCR